MNRQITIILLVLLSLTSLFAFIVLVFVWPYILFILPLGLLVWFFYELWDALIDRE